MKDGPWAGRNDVVHLGPGNSTVLNKQCLKRDLAPEFAARYLGWNQTRLTLGMGSYEEFTGSVEGKTSFEESGVHGGGHYGVGGSFGMFVLPFSFFDVCVFGIRWANMCVINRANG